MGHRCLKFQQKNYVTLGGRLRDSTNPYRNGQDKWSGFQIRGCGSRCGLQGEQQRRVVSYGRSSTRYQQQTNGDFPQHQRMTRERIVNAVKGDSERISCTASGSAQDSRGSGDGSRIISDGLNSPREKGAPQCPAGSSGRETTTTPRLSPEDVGLTQSCGVLDYLEGQVQFGNAEKRIHYKGTIRRIWNRFRAYLRLNWNQLKAKVKEGKLTRKKALKAMKQTFGLSSSGMM
jgi:hypothetical protein